MDIYDQVKQHNDSLLQNTIEPIRHNKEWDEVQPLTSTDILTSKPSPLSYAIYPWLPIQGIAFIYAATGVGKTLFTLNVAYAVAGGGSFLKYTAPLPRKVLYVDGEMSYVQVHSRFVDIAKQQGDLFFPDNFKLLTPDKSKIRPFKICQPDGQLFYNNIIEKHGIEVLFLDNLSMLSSFDENSSLEWKSIQDWLLDLRAKGVTVVVVHHAGKDKFGYRGTSRMLDAADTAISLQDITFDELEKDKVGSKKFKISYHKARNFGGKDSMPFEATLTSAGWEFESMEKNNTQRIIEMVDMGMKPSQIWKQMGVSETYVYKIIREARKKGIIIK